MNAILLDFLGCRWRGQWERCKGHATAAVREHESHWTAYRIQRAILLVKSALRVRFLESKRVLAFANGHVQTRRSKKQTLKHPALAFAFQEANTKSPGRPTALQGHPLGAQARSKCAIELPSGALGAHLGAQEAPLERTWASKRRAWSALGRPSGVQVVVHGRLWSGLDIQVAPWERTRAPKWRLWSTLDRSIHSGVGACNGFPRTGSWQCILFRVTCWL